MSETASRKWWTPSCSPGVSAYPLHLGAPDLGRQRVDDDAGDLVLHLEHVARREIVALRPQHGPVHVVGQLGHDPQAVVRPAQAAGQHVADAEVLAHLQRVALGVAEALGRTARDHHHLAQGGECGHDLFGEAVAKVMQRPLFLQRAERQHRDRRPLGPLQPRGAAVNRAHEPECPDGARHVAERLDSEVDGLRVEPGQPLLRGAQISTVPGSANSCSRAATLTSFPNASAASTSTSP